MASCIPLTKMVQQMNLKNVTPEIDISQIKVHVPDINRPALQLTGYFDHFAYERVQIVGYVEYTYLLGIPMEQKLPIYEKFVSFKIPCIIFTSKTEPDTELLNLCNIYGVPVFWTEKATSNFMAEIIRWMNEELAPCISIHGVLVDVFGEGVLIMGESGIGKSEAALELIKRGHRLVSDDVVEIRKISDVSLVGTAPDITRHFIELRGIGIIDVKTLYGVESGIGIKNMIDWGWKRNILNSWEIELYATPFRFARDEILPLLLRPQRSTTDRKRWDIMQHRNCTIEYSRIW